MARTKNDVKEAKVEKTKNVEPSKEIKIEKTKKVESSKEIKKEDTKGKCVKATAKTIRHPARKVRYVLDLIRGKDVKVALGILKFTPNHAAAVVEKVVKSAVANATHNENLDESRLFIKECYANEGFTLKRYMPRAKGSAGSIMKRTSHITVVVSVR